MGPPGGRVTRRPCQAASCQEPSPADPGREACASVCAVYSKIRISMQTSTPASAATPPRPGWLSHLGRAAAVVVGVEVGLLLLTLPWMSLWDHGIWVALWRQSHPAWLHAVLSPYFRGAVS